MFFNPNDGFIIVQPHVRNEGCILLILFPHVYLMETILGICGC